MTTMRLGWLPILLSAAIWAFLIGAGAVLSGCAALVAPNPATAVVAAPTQALYVAELAYNGFATAAAKAIESGAATGTVKASIQEIDRKAYSALQAARAGRASADSVLSILGTAQPLLKLLGAQQ